MMTTRKLCNLSLRIIKLVVSVFSFVLQCYVCSILVFLFAALYAKQEITAVLIHIFCMYTP